MMSLLSHSLPELSVVIAAKDASHTLGTSLHSLAQQAGQLNTEIIVATTSDDNIGDYVAAGFPEVKLVRSGEGALVPQLWKQGLDVAQAPIVAFTIAECVPSRGWLAAIMDALSRDADVAAIGGPLAGPGDAGSRLAWALYLARYSKWMPPGSERYSSVPDVPGDNSAYRRAALEQCRSEIRNGFWETLVNARLLANGERIIWNPDMEVQFTAAGDLGEIIETRFQHGRHYGSTRRFSHSLERLLYVVAAPMLIPLLLSRIFRRIQQQRPDWRFHFWRAFPHLLLILVSWSVGEASGYLVPDSRIASSPLGDEPQKPDPEATKQHA